MSQLDDFMLLVIVHRFLFCLIDRVSVCIDELFHLRVFDRPYLPLMYGRCRDGRAMGNAAAVEYEIEADLKF